MKLRTTILGLGLLFTFSTFASKTIDHKLYMHEMVLPEITSDGLKECANNYKVDRYVYSADGNRVYKYYARCTIAFDASDVLIPSHDRITLSKTVQDAKSNKYILTLLPKFWHKNPSLGSNFTNKASAEYQFMLAPVDETQSELPTYNEMASVYENLAKEFMSTKPKFNYYSDVLSSKPAFLVKRNFKYSFSDCWKSRLKTFEGFECEVMEKPSQGDRLSLAEVYGNRTNTIVDLPLGHEILYNITDSYRVVEHPKRHRIWRFYNSAVGYRFESKSTFKSKLAAEFRSGVRKLRNEPYVSNKVYVLTSNPTINDKVIGKVTWKTTMLDFEMSKCEEGAQDTIRGYERCNWSDETVVNGFDMLSMWRPQLSSDGKELGSYGYRIFNSNEDNLTHSIDFNIDIHVAIENKARRKFETFEEARPFFEKIAASLPEGKKLRYDYLSIE